MKKIISLALAAITLVVAVCLVGCSGYSSSYITTNCVRTNNPKSATLNFGSLKGSMVFTFKCDDGDKIGYTAKLEDGDATVYFDNGGGKAELFKIGAGDEISSRGDALVKGTVYVIIKTDGKCTGGEFDFKIVKE